MRKVIVIFMVAASFLFGFTGLQAAEPENIQTEPRMKQKEQQAAEPKDIQTEPRIKQKKRQAAEPKDIQTEPRIKQIESGKIPNKPGEDISATPITLP